MMEIEHNNDIVDSQTDVGPERTHPPCYAPLVRCAVEAKCCACAPMCATSPPADQRMTTRCRWCLPSANARPCCDHIPHALQTVDSIHHASSMVTAADQARCLAILHKPSPHVSICFRNFSLFSNRQIGLLLVRNHIIQFLHYPIIQATFDVL